MPDAAKIADALPSADQQHDHALTPQPIKLSLVSTPLRITEFPGSSRSTPTKATEDRLVTLAGEIAGSAAILYDPAKAQDRTLGYYLGWLGDDDLAQAFVLKGMTVVLCQAEQESHDACTVENGHARNCPHFNPGPDDGWRKAAQIYAAAPVQKVEDAEEYNGKAILGLVYGLPLALLIWVGVAMYAEPFWNVIKHLAVR